MDDPEYKAIKYIQNDFFDEINQRFIFWDMFPILQKIDYKIFSKMNRVFDENINLFKNKFQSHYKDYNESVVRDFCDTLITAKNDAIRAGKESFPYLNDMNLTFSMWDLFFAGIDTSQTTMNWILFLMIYYSEVLQKLRQEIESEIGDRIPTHEDRDKCHYVQAVITESLRFRNIAPTGLNHKAIVRSKIGILSLIKISNFLLTILNCRKLHNT